ncbi:hypothetical protein [Sphingobium indicum]
MHRALVAPAIKGLAQLLEAVDPHEELPVRGLAAITRLIAEAADLRDLDGPAARP